jgi:hypothetical protein
VHRAGETTIGDSPWEDTTKVVLVRFIKNGIETRIALRRLDRHKETVIVMLTTENRAQDRPERLVLQWQRYVVKEPWKVMAGKLGGFLKAN